MTAKCTFSSCAPLERPLDAEHAASGKYGAKRLVKEARNMFAEIPPSDAPGLWRDPREPPSDPRWAQSLPSLLLPVIGIQPLVKIIVKYAEECHPLCVWSGFVYGPEKTPFEGGRFNVELTFPVDYPFKPLRVMFTTPILHPNVCPHGGVSMASLQVENWSPARTVWHVLYGVQRLLEIPELDDECCYGPRLADYRKNQKQFEEAARELTKQKAKDPH